MENPLRILVLDDEDSVRQSLAAFLEDLDYTVSLAADAEEALDRIVQQSFDIAIVDIRLPGKDGNAFVREASQHRPDMHFIIHTGSKQYILPEDLRDLGITDDQVLHKPVANMTVFAEALRGLAPKGGD